MINEINFKELYEVSLKATYPIEVGGNIIEPGEIVAFFDKIQIANFQEIKSSTTANGGFDNRAHVFWESTKEIRIGLTQGVFSKLQFALMQNLQLIQDMGAEIIKVNMRKEFESDENGQIELKYSPADPVFVYDKTTGKKITDWTGSNNTITLKDQYKQVVIDYQQDYQNGYTMMRFGKPLTAGFLSLTGKMRIKDGATGKVVTGIIKIPKLRLMSDLSIRVGSDAIPQVGRLDAVAVPEGARGQSKVMEIIFLNDDIDADM